MTYTSPPGSWPPPGQPAQGPAQPGYAPGPPPPQPPQRRDGSKTFLVVLIVILAVAAAVVTTILVMGLVEDEAVTTSSASTTTARSPGGGTRAPSSAGSDDGGSTSATTPVTCRPADLLAAVGGEISGIAVKVTDVGCTGVGGGFARARMEAEDPGLAVDPVTVWFRRSGGGWTVMDYGTDVSCTSAGIPAEACAGL